MRVLGLVASPKDIRWALLDGTCAQPYVIPIPTKGQKLPANVDEGKILQSLYRLVCTLLTEQSVAKVSILQATHSQYRAASSRRIKVEAIIQLAVANLELRASLLSPQTVRAGERKFAGVAGGPPEAVLNGGLSFSPQAWRDAVLTAWLGLEEQ